MAEDNVQANIRIGIDTSDALVSIKNLQRQISAFHTSMANGSAANAAAAANFQKTLIDNINATKKFSASVQTVRTTTETFTNSLEKNKLSLGQYFRYAGGASKSFGRLFATEFETINKVARERVKDLQTQYIRMGRDANGAMRAIAVRPLVLDMDNLATKTAIAAQRQQLLNQLLKQGSTNLLNFGKNTQWAGRQLMVGFTIPLSIFGSTAAKSFMTIEEQAIKFKRVYGDLMTDTGQTDAMLESIKTLASEFTKYGIAVDKTMGLAASAAAQGKTGADLTAQVAEATRLSVLGQVEQQQALDTTISVTNAFGVAAEDLASKIDFLNAVENQTVTSIEDLTIAIPKAGPVVKQLGGNVEDLTFFLTAMREGGINASEGANALKSGLASLINPTEKASEMLAGYGINIKRIVESNKGDVKGIVIDFATALDKLDPLKRARAIEQLFGKFQFSRLSTLFQNVIGEGTQAQKVLEMTAQSSQSLAELSARELGKIAESPMFKFKKSIEDIKVALAPIGETFLKLATPVIEFGTKILNAFNSLDERTKNFVAGLVGVVGGIGPILLMTFGLLANGVANIIKGFTFVKNVFNGASVSSNDLGSQISYMTTEQIKAASVAASLDQVHGKLTQTFTSEATAIGAYVSALQRANTAAAAFNVPAMGRARPPQKFSIGGFVSGSGNGDTVPAMLTPGEFVVNKKSAQPVMPLLEAINSGKVAGFSRGGRIGSGPSGRAGKSKATLPINYKANVSNQSGAIDFSSILPDQQSLAYLYSDQILKNSGTSAAAVSKQIMLWERSNVSAINAATEAVQSGVPATEAFSQLADKFNKDMMSTEGPVRKFAESAKKIMPQLEADFAQAQTTAKQLNLNLRSAADTAKLADTLPDNMLAQSMNTPGNYQGLSRTRGAAASIFGGGSKNFGSTGVPSFMMSKGLDTKSAAYGSMMTQEHIAVTRQQEANREAMLKIRAEKDAKVVIKSMSEVLGKEQNDPLMLQRSQQRNSPHPQAGIDGADDAKARIAAEQKEYKRQSRRVQGVPTGNGGMSIVAVPAGSSQSAAAANAGGARTSRRVTVPQTNYDNIDLSAQKAAKSLDSVATVANKSKLSMIGLNNKLSIASLGISALSGAVMMFGDANNKAVTAINGLSTGIFAISSVMQMFGGTSLQGFLGDRKKKATIAARAAGAFGGDILGAAKQSGIMGGFKNFGGIIARAGIFVARFIGPVGLAIAGVTAFAGIVKFAIDQQEEQRRKIEGLGDAALLTKDKLNTLGSIFGVTPTQSPLERAAVAAPMSTVDRGQVDTLRSSQEFKDKFAKDIKTLTEATAREAQITLESMAIQLEGSGFAKEQIAQILTALQEESGKTRLKLDFESVSLNTKSGQKILEKNAKDLVSNFARSYADGFDEVSTQVYDELGGTGGIVKTFVPTEAFKKESATAGKTIAGMLTGISGSFASGVIDAEEFKSSVNNVTAAIQSMPEPNQIMLMNNILGEMNSPLAKAAQGVSNLKDKYLLLQAAMLGVNTMTESEIKVLQNGNRSTDGGAQRAYNRVKSKLTREISSFKAVYDSLAKELAGGDDLTGGGDGGDGEKSAYQKAIDQITEQTLAILQQTKAFNKLKAAGYDTEKAFEIAKDPILAAALASTKVGSKQWKALTAAINNSKKAAEDFKKVQAQTLEGATQQFDESYGKVNETFSALEEGLQLAFNKANKADLDLISSSQSQIVGLEYTIDNLNSALDDIQLQEDAINEKYDKRIDALDKIQSANDEISRQQKSQLSIADALSQGDISAAAKAIQDARAEDAQASIESQRKSVEAARSSEIGGVRVNGKTKTQIEKDLLDLQKQIKKIEEESLEPAEERIRLAEEKLQKDISALTVSEKTKAEWDLIANNIRIAKTQTDDFVKSLNDALSAANNLTNVLKGLGAVNAKGTVPMVDANITPAQYAAVLASAKSESSSSNLGGSGIAGPATARLLRMSSGGMVPKYFASGGFARGTDTVPSMLTPGEFVVKKYAVQDFGTDRLKAINNGTYSGESVYNYELNVNVKSDANPDQIARAVMTQIKQIDSQRLRGNRL